MLIGKRIKDLRETQRMSLTELSAKSGVQMATLSRMENLKMTGTVASHTQIAKALGVSLTDLYRDIEVEEKLIDLQTPETLSDVFVHSDKSSYEILTNKVLNKKMMPVLLKIEPDGVTNFEQNQIGAEKFIFVLEGTIEVAFERESYPLSKNNSLYFNASLKHRFINKGRDLAQVICVTTPVAL